MNYIAMFNDGVRSVYKRAGSRLLPSGDRVRVSKVPVLVGISEIVSRHGAIPVWEGMAFLGGARATGQSGPDGSGCNSHGCVEKQ